MVTSCCAYACSEKYVKGGSITFHRPPPCQLITSSSHSLSQAFIFFVLICNFCHVSGDCSEYHTLPPENVKTLTSSINEMTLNLHKSLVENNATGKVFYSPLSIAVALEMLFYGTRGETAEELREVLRYNNAGISDELVHQAFHQLLCDIGMDTDPSNHNTLTLVNSILVDQRLGMLPSYKNDAEELFDASVQNVDFARDASAVVWWINDWVYHQTRGMIQELVRELDGSTSLVLLNAVYFKGIWQHQFDESSTRKQLFYNDGLRSKARNVPMMYIKNTFHIHYDHDCTVLEMPYKGGNFSMLIVLPKSLDGLPELEKRMTIEKLADIYKKMKKEEVEVQMPKFKFQYRRVLNHNLQAMGANSIFDAGTSDFSGMSSADGVYVSDVIHTAVIQVDEKGSEAAAATAVVANTRSAKFSWPPPPQFIVNHPFLFFVLNKRSGIRLMLFVGRVSQLD